MRKILRTLASMLAAGGIAFGASVSAAFSNGGAVTDATYWVIVGAILAAMAKDLQASLSEPPGTSGPGEAYDNLG